MGKTENVLICIREAKDGMTKSEKRIAAYIENNIEAITNLSVKQLSLNCATSQASIIRYCKMIGFKGYRDFVLKLSATLGSLSSEEKLPYTDIQPTDDIHTIIKNISYSNCQAINDTLQVLDEGAVEKAIEVLHKAKRFDFYGIGASSLVCKDAQQKFFRIHKDCHAFSDGHEQLTAAALLSKGDVVVIISNSGQTREILEVIELANKVHAVLIAITRCASSPLADSADIALSISSPEIQMRSGAMGSRIAMLNVVDILFVGVASKEYAKAKKSLEKTHSAVTERDSKHA